MWKAFFLILHRCNTPPIRTQPLALVHQSVGNKAIITCTVLAVFDTASVYTALRVYFLVWQTVSSRPDAWIASCPHFGLREILNLILITDLPAGVAHIAAVPEVSKLTASSMPRFQAVLKEQIEAINVSSSRTKDSAQDSKEKIQSARQQSSILLMHRLPVYRTRMLQFSQLTAPSKVGEIS